MRIDDDITERLRRKVHGGTYGSGMEVPPLHAEAAYTIDRLRDKLENLVIAIGMGWGLDGVVMEACKELGWTVSNEEEKER